MSMNYVRKKFKSFIHYFIHQNTKVSMKEKVSTYGYGKIDDGLCTTKLLRFEPGVSNRKL